MRRRTTREGEEGDKSRINEGDLEQEAQRDSAMQQGGSESR